MFEALKTTVCQIAVFMICAQAIAHFRPREVYEKYLRMLLGVMIMIQIFQPFCRLFFGVTGQELSATVEAFQQEFDSSMAAAAKQSAIAAQRQEDLSLLALQERLAEQADMEEGGSASEGTASSTASVGTAKEAASPAGDEHETENTGQTKKAEAPPQSKETPQIEQVQVEQIQIEAPKSEEQ